MPTTIIGDTVVAYFAINALLFFIGGIELWVDLKRDNETKIRDRFLAEESAFYRVMYIIFFPVLFPLQIYLEVIDEYGLWEEMTEK